LGTPKPQADLLAALHTLGNLHRLQSVEVSRSTARQRGLGHVDRQDAVEIVLVTLVDVVRLDADDDVQVAAGRHWRRAGLFGQAQTGAGIDTGGDVDA
jgi:hypothetical protein